MTCSQIEGPACGTHRFPGVMFAAEAVLSLEALKSPWVGLTGCTPAGALAGVREGIPETAPDNTTLTAAKSLIQCAVYRGFLSESYTLKGHCNVKSTQCPGDALYEAISQWPEFEA
ncbi:unnamed protein product [Lepidochelys kempii]